MCWHFTFFQLYYRLVGAITSMTFLDVLLVGVLSRALERGRESMSPCSVPKGCCYPWTGDPLNFMRTQHTVYLFFRRAPARGDSNVEKHCKRDEVRQKPSGAVRRRTAGLTAHNKLQIDTNMFVHVLSRSSTL